MAYATAAEVAKGFRTLDENEQLKAESLLDEAAAVIDTYAKSADEDVKGVVSCRMVRRALASGDADTYPLGATQGSMTAGSYMQSWTVSNGSVGELYLSKTEKAMLGIGNRIGVTNPYEGLTYD